MRSRCFVGVQGLIKNLQSNFFSTKLEAAIAFIRNFFGAFQGGSVDLDELRQLHPTRHVDGDDAAILHELKLALKICLTDLTGRDHVLFLDEMDMCSELAASWPDAGRHAVKILMDAMKVTTKSCKSVSVIGGCKPCFCYDIVHNVHFKDYFELCFVGDLSRDNAQRMYSHLARRLLPEELQEAALMPETFSRVFELVGGRVGDIRDMLIHIGATKGDCSVMRFPAIARHRTRLLRLLVTEPVEFDQATTWEVDICKPRWTCSQVAKAFVAIIDCDNAFGCVPLHKMLEILGDRQVLRSMFEHDILLYRPQFPLHEDYEENRFCDFVSPYSPLDHYCIKNFLTSKAREMSV
eukprot:CAMPEP_0177611322 /NCGR_PEP_ID=MMETSP0419_2-20121207/20423_1 /TAXON_ID=582737 /ORGANISM="Tetraselmis sp., Strain GSL018" /LENGTH=350 /DNA_ID=CAMNT_0019107031 /DNA_START=148 /DNA_END=1200 /DNA_ORIENTATION=+